MDAAGVDRAVIHPVMWDPDSNELAVEAARAHPDRFAIMGWFYLDQPDQRALIETWKSRPGMKGLRFYFSDPRSQSWPDDGTLDWLWPVAERLGIPVSLQASAFLPRVGEIAERHPGLKLSIDHMGVPRATEGADAAYRNLPQLLALAKHPNVAVKATGRPAMHGRVSVPQHSRCVAPGVRRIRPAAHVLGHRHHPHALHVAAVRDPVHRGTALAARAPTWIW